MMDRSKIVKHRLYRYPPSLRLASATSSASVARIISVVLLTGKQLAMFHGMLGLFFFCFVACTWAGARRSNRASMSRSQLSRECVVGGTVILRVCMVRRQNEKLIFNMQ